MRRIAVLVALGCNGGASECLELDDACAPLYEPEFDQVFTQTLSSSCGVGGGSCHGSEGGQAGLFFAEPDEAWGLLTEDSGDGPLVVPGEAGCSPLIQVLRSEDDEAVMPPGDPLSEAEICAIEQWIDAGAER
jgi:hypothetical protein